MKKITLLLGLLFASQSWAQDCNALTYYTENFESVTTPAIPACTSVTGANTWSTVNNPGNGFESNTLRYTGNAQAADAWFFTKGIAMTQGTWYKISYRYGNNGASTENLEVTFGTNGNSTDNPFQTHNGITGGTPATMSLGLYPAPGTGTYYLGFHATSVANQGNIYVDDIIVEPIICNTPTNLNVTNLTTTSATFSWNAPVNELFTVYHYGYMTSNTPPVNPEDIKYSLAPTASVTDLLPGTTYYLFARTQCQPMFAEWSEPIVFTTPICASTTVSYIQNFETATVPNLPECTTGNGWVTANNPGNGFENNTLKYATGTDPANAWFFTQGINLPQGYYRISYKYGNDSSTSTEKLKVIMATSPNAASIASTFGDFTEITGGTASTFNTANPLTITPETAGVYYFGFNAYSDASQGNLYVDDFLVEPWTCSEPANITASNITTTGATVSWEAQGNPAVGYLIAFNTTNDAPTDQTFVPGLTTNLTELEPGTTYYFFIKGICGPVMGEWSQSISFTTPLCAPTTVPYILDFESATVPGVPSCTMAQEAISGNDWITANNPGSGFTSKALVYTGTNDAANSWFYTQGVEITAGTMYKVSFKYGNNGTSTENLKVTLNTNPNPDFQIGENFGTLEGITGGTQQEFFIQYFNMPTGVYYFGFNAYSDAGQGAIYVDDFKIEVIDCGEPANGTATDITTTTATIAWEAATSGNASLSVYHYAYGTTEELPTEWENVPALFKAQDGLTANTQYYAFVRSQCGPTYSEWITIPFHTLEVAGLGENTFKNITAYPNPVKDVLNLDAMATIEKVEVYSITGQLVHAQNVNSQNATVNLQQLSAGAYLVNVIGEGGSKRIKIIKE